MNLETRNQSVRDALALHPDKGLSDEIEHFLFIDDDEERDRDVYDALEQAHDLAVEHSDRKMMKAARLVLIELGYFRTISEDELRRTQTLGGKKFDFTLKGQKYVWSHHLELTA